MVGMVDKLVIVLEGYWPDAGPNRLKGQHWSKYHAVKKSCIHRITFALIEQSAGVYRPFCFDSPVRLHIVRQLAGRDRVMDDENALAATKPLIDALRRQKISYVKGRPVVQGGLGIIYDDDKKHLVRDLVEQIKSPDGVRRTILTIEGAIHDHARSWNQLDPIAVIDPAKPFPWTHRAGTYDPGLERADHTGRAATDAGDGRSGPRRRKKNHG